MGVRDGPLLLNSQLLLSPHCLSLRNVASGGRPPTSAVLPLCPQDRAWPRIGAQEKVLEYTDAWLSQHLSRVLKGLQA